MYSCDIVNFTDNVDNRERREPINTPNEKLLNQYFNKGRYNHPKLVGPVMDLIRTLKPLTLEEWYHWYITNIRSLEYIWSLACSMNASIPAEHGITAHDCYRYICDVIFRRTFNGYNKEKQALGLLHEKVSPSIQESPAEWDSRYFIDFFGTAPRTQQLIGIQLKPETFYLGNYQSKVDIEEKIQTFCNSYNALAYVLAYRNDGPENGIEFVNPGVVDALRYNLA